MKNEEPLMLHAWMYSYMPKNHNNWTDIFLVGYCKNCRNSFAELVPSGNDMKVTAMTFPKWGCVPVEMP